MAISNIYITYAMDLEATELEIRKNKWCPIVLSTSSSFPLCADMQWDKW